MKVTKDELIKHKLSTKNFAVLIYFYTQTFITINNNR